MSTGLRRYFTTVAVSAAVSGDVAALPPKAIDTLLALVEGRGRVMDKDELMREVWGDTIVEEVGLAKNISVLRKALGESLGEQRFIVTVQGRGYRFVASVSLVPVNGGHGVNGAADGDVVMEPRSIARMALDETIAPTGSAVRHGVRGPRVALRMGLAVTALLALGASAYWFYVRPHPALTDRDTILLADFVNRTGDPIFDDTLAQGLAAQLEQSPFFNLLPAASLRERLRMIGLPPEHGVTRDAAQEICRREGLKAFVMGGIAPLGSHYAITLEAIDHNATSWHASSRKPPGASRCSPRWRRRRAGCVSVWGNRSTRSSNSGASRRPRRWRR